MPKLAGRRAFYAALAVPIAMVIAPLTASAGEADDTVVTEQAQSGAVTTENETAAAANATDGPGWYVMSDADVVHSESEDTQVTYVLNGIHDDTVIGNSSEETTVVENDDDGFSPGPAWYWAHEADGADVVHSESEDTQVTYVVNGIYDDSVVGNSSEDNTVVLYDESDSGPGWHDSDDADIVHSESEDTQVTYVVNGIHDDTVIGNSSEENTFVSHGVDEYVVVDHDDDDAYEHGGYEDGHEHGGYEDGGYEEGGYEDDDDTTSTYFEEVSVGAGEGGAYADSTESGTFEQD